MIPFVKGVFETFVIFAISGANPLAPGLTMPTSGRSILAAAFFWSAHGARSLLAGASNRNHSSQNFPEFIQDA
jgi:hypothetical protein